jgi:hypothetical protein
MHILFFVKIVSAGLSLAAAAQDTTGTNDSTFAAEKTHLNIGVTYNSTMNYYGRTDSLKSHGIYPFVGVSLKDGLYANASFVFIGNALRREYAATVLEGGYNFTSRSGHWSGNLSATKYYYQQNTDLIQSVIKGIAAASLTNLNKIANVTAEVDARFSDQVDAGLQGGLDHTIRLKRLFSATDVLVIDPTATVYAGTQHFTQTFLEQQKILFIPTGEAELTSNSQVFSVLAYEASLPIVYGYKGLNLVLDPAYVLPQHVLLANGQMAASGAVSNLFYITLTAKISIGGR